MADVSRRMNGSGGNEQFFARHWMLDLSLQLELHFSLKDDHHIIGGMCKVLPALPGRIDPEFATEAA